MAGGQVRVNLQLECTAFTLCSVIPHSLRVFAASEALFAASTAFYALSHSSNIIHALSQVSINLHAISPAASYAISTDRSANP